GIVGDDRALTAGYEPAAQARVRASLCDARTLACAAGSLFAPDRPVRERLQDRPELRRRQTFQLVARRLRKLIRFPAGITDGVGRLQCRRDRVPSLRRLAAEE